MVLNKLGFELELARSQKTKYELSKASGVSYATIGRVIRGERARPDTFGRLAKALGVSVEKIVN